MDQEEFLKRIKALRVKDEARDAGIEFEISEQEISNIIDEGINKLGEKERKILDRLKRENEAKRKESRENAARLIKLQRDLDAIKISNNPLFLTGGKFDKAKFDRIAIRVRGNRRHVEIITYIESLLTLLDSAETANQFKTKQTKRRYVLGFFTHKQLLNICDNIGKICIESSSKIRIIERIVDGLDMFEVETLAIP